MVEPQAATAQDDTETEIELHALHVLEQPRTGGTSGERRTSLDRAHTMPVSSFDEGHKALQDFRQRRMAREAARSSKAHATIENRDRQTPQRVSQGSAPPSVRQGSDLGRSPSRTTISSTLSLKRQRTSDESPATVPLHPDSLEAAASTPLPAFATDSLADSSGTELAGLPAVGMIREASSKRNSITSRRPSAKRAMSDGPLISRQSSRNTFPTLLQTDIVSISRPATEDEETPFATPSIRTMSGTDLEGGEEIEKNTSRPASLIDHGEAAEAETASLVDSISADVHCPRSLSDKLRDHRIPTFESTAYGIPKSVIVGGQSIDISEMGILEQVEMIRQAQQEAKHIKNNRLPAEGTGTAQNPPMMLDLYKSMPSTDLSVIAERTECSTYSRRSTIAPTNRSESLRSPQVAAVGRSLAPTYARSRLSVSTTNTGISDISKVPQHAEAGSMTEAERIRNRYLRKVDSEQVSTSRNKSDQLHSGKSTSKAPPSHRKYTSVGDITFHTYPLSPPGSSKGNPGKAVLPSLGLPSIANVTKPTRRPSGSSPVPGAQSSSRKPLSSQPSSVLTVDWADSPFAPSSAPPSKATGMISPSKIILSPTISAKVEKFRSAIPNPPNDHHVAPLYRKRSKSMHGDGRSARSLLREENAQLPSSPSLPILSAVCPPKTTSALVQMFESKSSNNVVQDTPSPVKEWLKKVDRAKVPPSPGLYSSKAPSVSSASGSMTDHYAFARRKAKHQDPLNSAASSSTFAKTRRRSQSLTALPQVLVTQEEQTIPTPTRSASTFSFDDSEIVHHSDLYWLNSSSAVLPPFWQACRGILTARDELRISWLGPESGITHERFFDLGSCTAAHSIRRTPDTTSTVVHAYDPESRPVTREELSRLQVFELVWPGRTQRFACIDLSSRMKWLGHIFVVLAKYSTPNTPFGDQIEAPAADERSPGSAAIQSPLHLPRTVSSSDRSASSTSASTPQIEVPRRQLEKEMQASLYASVSEMLDGQAISNKSSVKVEDLPDVPKYQLTDCGTPKAQGFHTPSSHVVPGAKPLRGAWSDFERGSTKSNISNGVAPAAKSVARDLKRILTMVGRSRSNTASSAVNQEFPDQLREMQTHLERISRDIQSASVASRHSRHAPDMISKMNEVLGLCRRMAEEHRTGTTDSQAKPGDLAMQAVGEVSNRGGQTELQGKQPGLDRLEEKVETLLEVVNRLAAAESPTGQKQQSKSPERLPPKVGQSDRSTFASGIHSQASAPPVTAAYMANQRAFDMLPTTPDLMMRLDADFDKDIEQWKKYDKKRNSALPPLPAAKRSLSRSTAEPRDTQALREQANLTEFYNSLARRPVKPSSRPSSVVSSNRVRNARSDAAMRLEGSHPALLANQVRVAPAVPEMCELAPASKWSADTASPEQARRTLPVKTVKTVGHDPSSKSTSVEEASAGDETPPTPRQQHFIKPKGLRPASVADGSSAPLADRKTQDTMAFQLNTMENLLNTLLTAQSKQTESLKHQEEVSVHIKHLQEYLTEDRTHHKEEFDTIKSSLASISQQLLSLPKKLQNMVETSLATAKPQPASVDGLGNKPPSPAPAPDNDVPAMATTVSSDDAKPAENTQAAQAVPTSKSQGKKNGASLLRKVSLGLAGMAGAGTGHPGIKVGGPRKMGATRLFGHPPAGSTAPDARDRWRAGRYKTGDAAAGDPSTSGVTLPAEATHAMADPQAPLLDALEGFQQELSEGGEENEDRQTIIALGILELIKMVKDLEARQNEREHYQREDHILRMDLERERHAEQIEAVRKELQEWEAKREELAAQQHRDPENEEGIEQIIALLKDQMANQESALLNLRESLTPKIKDIGLESEEAILAIREEMSKSLADFRTQLDDEVKKTLDEVGALRDQKKQLQSDLSDLLAFKSKYGGGAPEAVQQQKQPPLKPATYAGLYAQPAHLPKPVPRQAPSHGYPPPRPDTSLSNGANTWGLRGPR